MCVFISCCTQEIASTPPATKISPSPAMMRCDARAIVCRLDEQKRFTVMPGTVTGQPARRAIWRAMLAPVAPSGVAQPMMTSSISAGSRPARLMACSTAWPPSVAPCVMLKEPFQLLASGVRAVETITADVMGESFEMTEFELGLGRLGQKTLVKTDELGQISAGNALVGAVKARQIFRL